MQPGSAPTWALVCLAPARTSAGTLPTYCGLNGGRMALWDALL